VNHNFNENAVQSLINGYFETFTSQFDEDVEVVVDTVDIIDEELDIFINTTINCLLSSINMDHWFLKTCCSYTYNLFQCPCTMEEAFMVNLYHLCDQVKAPLHLCNDIIKLS